MTVTDTAATAAKTIPVAETDHELVPVASDGTRSLTVEKTDPQVKTVSPGGPIKAQRLVSLDALRGLDMFWIIGAEKVIEQLSALSDWKPLKVVAAQLEHRDWDGFNAEDLIFPMFVFIVGVSLVFSLTKQLAVGGKRAAIGRIIVRAAVLYLFGIIYYGGLSKGYGDVRLLGVLQRIALSYLGAGLLYCFLRTRGLVMITVGILVGYWLLLAFVPVPAKDHQGAKPSFEEGKNWPNYVDSKFLPLFKWDGDHDPEGLVSTLPAVASCLLGVFAGLLLKSAKFGPYSKFSMLLLAGAACGALGYAWGHSFPAVPWLEFPIIKKLWTSSFVLVAAGYSAVLLALFYLLIDIWKLRGWAKPFVWVGSNAIALYMICHLFSFSGLARRFIGGEFSARVLHSYANLVAAVLAFLFVLLFARFLYRRQMFIRA